MSQTTHLIAYDGVHVFNDLRVYVNATYPDMELTRSWNLHPCEDGGLLVTGCCYEWRIGVVGGDAMQQWLWLWRVDADGKVRWQHKLDVKALLRVNAFALDNLSIGVVDENLLLLAVGTDKGAVVLPAYLGEGGCAVDWASGVHVVGGLTLPLAKDETLVGLALPWVNVSLSPAGANWRLDCGRWQCEVGLRNSGKVWTRFYVAKGGEWLGALAWEFAGTRYDGALGNSGSFGTVALSGDVRHAVNVRKEGPMPGGGGGRAAAGREGDGGGSEPAPYEDLDMQQVAFSCRYGSVFADMRPAAPDHGLYHDMRHYAPLAHYEIRCPWEGDSYKRNRLDIDCCSGNVYRYSHPFINYANNLCVVDGQRLRVLLASRGGWWEGHTLNDYVRATFPRAVQGSEDGSGNPSFPDMDEKERVVRPSVEVYRGPSAALGQTGWLVGVSGEGSGWLLTHPGTLRNYVLGRDYTVPDCRQEGEALEWSKADWKWSAFMQRVVTTHLRYAGVEIVRFKTAAGKLWVLHKTVCFDPCGNSDDTLEKGSSLHLTRFNL